MGRGHARARGWPSGAHEATQARDLRHLLLPALQAVQARIGWISPGGLNYICERLTVPPADAYGVATFYGLLSVQRAAAARPARVRRRRLPLPRGRGADRGPRGALRTRARGARRRDLAAQPVPRPVRSAAPRRCSCGPATSRCSACWRRSPRRRRSRRCGARTRPSPTRRRSRSRASRGCGSCGGSGSSTPTACTTTAPPAATRRCAARSRWDRRRCSASSRTPAWSGAAARRSRPGSSGRPSPSSRFVRTT